MVVKKKGQNELHEAYLTERKGFVLDIQCEAKGNS